MPNCRRDVCAAIAATVLLASPGACDVRAESADKIDAATLHEQLMANERFPSARQCGSCHPKHFKEWSASQHAYAQISPIFNAMQGAVGKITDGSVGDFCIRCHTPVGISLGEPVFMSNVDRHPTSREGVTCIACHRQAQTYGKVNGRLAVAEGDLTKPIYGPSGDNANLEAAIEAGGLVTEADRPGRQVHGRTERFFALTTSGFCGSCHDLTSVGGFRLQEVFSEWKRSAAAEQGIDCQDCHMGVEPGRVVADPEDPEFERKNYASGPAAVVGTHETPARKLTSHRFVGPDYSVVHPALFPFNSAAIREEAEADDASAEGVATIRDWLDFDWRAGWGTDAFEDEFWDDEDFPERWADVDSRYEARELLQENLLELRRMRDLRLALFRNGYRLGEVVTDELSPDGLEFRIQVQNGTNAHNVPSGDDGERLVWLHVQVVDAAGKVLFESGDLDPNGDLRDTHSKFVHNREMELDSQLFNLQSKFLMLPLRGAEIDQVIPIPFKLTALPFMQKSRRSSILQGQSRGGRRHRKGIPAGQERWATYRVGPEALTGVQPYRAIVSLRAGMVPVHLVDAIRIVGFDYGMSAREIASTLVNGFVDEKGEVVIWDPESDDPEDNRVVGHQTIWRKEVLLDSAATVATRASK